uniref:Uncharacterized protein n=1 Tax=Anopheles epiroticus TaxID=199890 RepID=A0A182PUQ7_9DIPT
MEELTVSPSQFTTEEDDPQIHGSTSRTMAAISLGFIVIVTPWTILEIVATCTGSKCTGSRSSLEEKCSISLEYDHHLTSLPLPPGPPPATICRSANQTPRPDVECSEKYWGDILERTFSSGSVNTLHRLGSGSLPFVNRAPAPTHLPVQYRCEAHQHHLMRNASSTSIDKERHSTGSSHYKDAPSAKDASDTFGTLYAPGSDPQVCDHELHDINCAKNKAFFRGFNLHQGLPDI